MAMNLRTQTMPTGESVPVAPPPSPEDLREKFPQFEILECLGRGGMGIVYRARQKALDRVVALKILAGEWQDEAGFAGRFEKEAKLLARLNHPNIVTIHDFGRAGELYYIVMEYVDGVNVRDLLRDGRLESEQALAIVPPICDALQFAHDHGVVHRDIKPENILLDREGRVKIADFGIATMAGDAADRSGTPAYMAPEQAAHAQAVDHRADIYALGVVLHEMLTGERPAAGAVPSARVQIDVRLDEIVLRSLAAKPELRFQQVSEVKSLVTQVMLTPPPAMQAGAGAEAEVAAKPERVKVKVRLVPWRMFLKAGAAVLLVAAIFRLWTQSYLYAAEVPHLVAAGSYMSGNFLPLACFTVLAWLGYRRHVREHGRDERPWWQRKAASAAGLCMAFAVLVTAISYFGRLNEVLKNDTTGLVVKGAVLVLWVAGILLGIRARKSFEGRWALGVVLLLVMLSLARTGIDALRYEWYPPYRAKKTRLHEEKAASQMVGQPGVKLAIDLESGAAITYTWAPVSFERRMEEWGADLSTGATGTRWT
jgi:predicted Ser/Thr protein kinase